MTTREELLKLAKEADARTINDVNMEMLVGDLAFDLNSLATFAALLLAQAQPQDKPAAWQNKDDPKIIWRGDSPPAYYDWVPLNEASAEQPQGTDQWNAAIEATARICDEMGEHYGAYKDTALLNGDVQLSNAASGEPRAAEFLAQAIRDLARPSQPQEPSQPVGVVDERKLRSTMDAEVWADEFCKGYPLADKELMIGWFANAIMCGFDEGQRQAQQAPVSEPNSQPIQQISACSKCGLKLDKVMNYCCPNLDCPTKVGPITC